MRGTLDEHVIASEALRGNPLGDPHERPLWVYTPPSYAGGPAVYVLQGFTGQLEMWRNRAAFRPTFLELLDDADIDARVVFVDAWTSVGGSQFVDSAGSGRYHSYICDEIVPFVDERYETNGYRGVAGKSSGGQGAAVTAMLRPDLFQGFASHAGGGLFEVSIRPFFRVAARRLRDALRRLDRALPRRAAHRPGAALASGRPAHPAPVGLLRCVLRRRGRHDPASLRRRHGPGDPGALGALARVGLPDARAAPRRCAPRDARDLRRLRHARRVVPRPDRRVAPPRADARSASRDLHVELFDATHLAIEYRYPIGLRYLADRLR